MSRKHKPYRRGLMGRSDIPFAQRMAMKLHHDIAVNRSGKEL